MKKFKIIAGSTVTLYLYKTMEIEADDMEEAKDLAVDDMIQAADVQSTDIAVQETA